MPVEDKMLQMKIRRNISRRNVELAKMEIDCSKGMVTLRGVLTGPRGIKMDLEEELRIIMEIISKIPQVRDVKSELQIYK